MHEACTWLNGSLVLSEFRSRKVTSVVRCLSDIMASLLQSIDKALQFLQSFSDDPAMELSDVMKEIPSIDLTPLIENGATNDVLSVGKQILESLHKYGILIIKDDRLTPQKTGKFIDMMEDYFNRSTAEKMKDVRKEHHFQVGATPEKQEKARNHCGLIETLDPTHRPLTPCPPEADTKWRYFWKLKTLQKQQQKDQKKEHVFPNVVPAGIPHFESMCNEIGADLLNCAYTVLEGLALGLGLQKDYFTSKMHDAAHLLAPTATDLNKWGKKGVVMAGYHYDLNLLTVHGKSRYEGLYIWLRDGRKVKVKVPDGYILCQAAKQLEWVTGGYIYAGFHEVVVDEGTLQCMEKWRKKNRPLWRISCTCFSHFNGDVKLDVIEQFKNKKTVKKYPPISTWDQVMGELKKIGLA
eukprot:1041908_1